MPSPFSRHRVQREQGFALRRKEEKGKRFAFTWQRVLGGLCALIVLLLLWIYFLLGPFRPFFGDLFSLAGFGFEKNYLLLFHNENELRPTGGFITGFAVLKMHWGIPTVSFFSSEAVANPEPQVRAPEPIERVFGADPKYAGWVFRDANFDLDFSRNARRAIDFLRADPRFADMEFTGVFGLDLELVGQIVDVLGPVEIAGTEVTSANLFSVLQLAAKNFDQHDLEEWQQRKSALSELGSALLERMPRLFFSGRAFTDLLAGAAEQKHLLFFFADPERQEEFVARNWSGTLPFEPFWSVNIANLGGRKGDRFLRKEFASTLSVDAEGQINERFTIDLEHQGTYNLQSDRYEAFVRIVRPQGVTLRDFSGDFETTPVQNEQEYGEEVSFFVVLWPGETKILHFTFDFPKATSLTGERDTFPVSLLKQPGDMSPLWKFTWRGANDVGFGVQGCGNALPRENVLFCDVALSTDQKLLFQRLPDRTPPLLQFARFVEPSLLEARFSEDIAPLEADQVQLAALSGRTFEVTRAKVEKHQLFLTLAQAPVAADGKFVLTIQGLKDISGNAFPGATPGAFSTTISQE